jgi:prepilin-type N-terminal cleavage/methylation domain-containing protein
MRSNTTAGFTLIEVLISIVILTFISLGIYQSTTETFHLREILSNEGDFYNSIRLSMNIMQRDISMIYSPTLMSFGFWSAGGCGQTCFWGCSAQSSSFISVSSK